eukprot:4040703-Prorocentrum_lima.AAC.1
MTSSLVGSEMCIRDRSDCVWGAHPSVKVGRLQHGRRKAAQVPKWVAWRPVSYTHLTLPTICSV